MWWESCEFRGRESVQRGKYPGFRRDSEEGCVTLGSWSCHCAAVRATRNRKKVSRNRRASDRGPRVGARQEGKSSGEAGSNQPRSREQIAETRVAVGRISPQHAI